MVELIIWVVLVVGVLVAGLIIAVLVGLALGGRALLKYEFSDLEERKSRRRKRR